MNIKNEFLLVVGSDDQICWAAQLEDGSLVLMDRDMRIIDNDPWHHTGMGFSGEEETLAEHVEWWIDQEWFRDHADELDEIFKNLKTVPTSDF